MKKENVEQLHGGYTLIINDRRPPWGISCGDGWFDLIKRLCHYIQHHIDGTNEQRVHALAYNEMVLSCRFGDFTEFDRRYGDSGNQQYVTLLRQRMIDGTEALRDVPDTVPQVEAIQIKEKFGGLRFNIRGGDDYIRGLIAFAESMSYTICDVCGEKGSVGNQDIPKGSTEKVSGYYATRCDAHWGRRVDF